MTEPTPEEIQSAFEPRTKQDQQETPPEPRDLRAEQVDIAIRAAMAKVGALEVDTETAHILSQPFDDQDVEIRPDGLIFLPHILISERLNQAFGPGSWAIIRRSGTHTGGEVKCEFVLIVKGCYVGEAPASAAIRPKMTLDDVYEGCQGIALRRIAAKFLSVGNQCWKPAYARQWVKQFAEEYWTEKWDYKTRSNKKVKLWRKKGQDPELPHIEPEGSEGSPDPKPDKTPSRAKSEARKGNSTPEEEEEGIPWWKTIPTPIKFGKWEAGTAIMDIRAENGSAFPLKPLCENFRVVPIPGVKEADLVKFREALDAAAIHYKWGSK